MENSGSDQGDQLPEGAKPGKAQTSASGCGQVAGDVSSEIVVDTTDVIAMIKGTDRAIHQKAVRRVAALFAGVGACELDAIAVVVLWCQMAGRLGGAEAEIVDWAGYRYNYKKRLKEGMRKCVGLGLLEFLKIGENRIRICPTTKGERILKIYTDKFEEVKQDIKTRQINKAIKREGMRRRNEAKVNAKARSRQIA